MRAVLLGLLVLLAACAPEAEDAPAATAARLEPELDTFTIGNGEIRADMLAEFEARGIQYWINEDNSISVLAADGERVDQVVYYVRGLYAARN